MAKPRLRVIPSESARVDRDCVRMMAEMYRRSLRGEFQAVAIATVTEGAAGPNAGFGAAWSAPEHVSQMAGSIGYLNHRYMQEEIYNS